MAGPTIEIKAPARADRTGGISKVAEFRVNDRIGATQGVVFQSDGCTFPQISEHLCYVGELAPADKTFDGIAIENAIGDPFPLYAGVKCFIGPDPDELERAESALRTGQDRGLEEALATWAAGGTVLEAGPGAAGAIANVEQELDDSYIGRGVILMSRGDATLAFAEGAIEYGLDGIPTTVNGTPVLASGRVPRGTVYGLGAIAVDHSAAESRDVLDPETNTHWALAEAVYSIAVDCSFRVGSVITATGGGAVDPETLQRITDLETETAALQTAVAGKADTVHTHAAADVTSGTFADARIPALAATKVTSGTFADARIPALAIAKTTGLQAALDDKVASVTAGTGVTITGTASDPIISVP